MSFRFALCLLFCVLPRAFPQASSRENVVRNGDFIPKISVGKLSRVKTVAGVDGWKVSRGGAFVVHDKSFYPSHLLDNPTYNITLASHSIQIPQVSGRAVSQVLKTKGGVEYIGEVVIHCPRIASKPATVLVSAVDSKENLLFFDFLTERMTTMWSVKHFSFVASGEDTTLTFSSVATEDETSPSRGVSIASVTVKEASEAQIGLVTSKNGKRKLLGFSDENILSLRNEFRKASNTAFKNEGETTQNKDQPKNFMGYLSFVKTQGTEKSVESSKQPTTIFPDENEVKVEESSTLEASGGGDDEPCEADAEKVDFVVEPGAADAPFPGIASVDEEDEELAENDSNFIPGVTSEPELDDSFPSPSLPPDLASKNSGFLGFVEAGVRASMATIRQKKKKGKRESVPLNGENSLEEGSFTEAIPEVDTEITIPSPSLPPDLVSRSDMGFLAQFEAQKEALSATIRQKPPKKRQNGPQNRQFVKGEEENSEENDEEPCEEEKQQVAVFPNVIPDVPEPDFLPSPSLPPELGSNSLSGFLATFEAQGEEKLASQRVQNPEFPIIDVAEGPEPEPIPHPLVSNKNVEEIRVLPVSLYKPRALKYISVDHNADNARISENDVVLSVDRTGGSRWQSLGFSFGYFQAKIQCPRGATSGITTKFYLDSLKIGQNGFGFSFSSEDTQSVRATVNLEGKEENFPLKINFDCSAEAHVFSLSWEGDKLGWYVDFNLVHSHDRNTEKYLIDRPLYLFGSISDDSFGSGNEAEIWNNFDSFSAFFQDISVQSRFTERPREPTKQEIGLLPDTSPSSWGKILSPINSDFCPEKCLGCNNEKSHGNVTIKLNNICGSRFSSSAPFKQASVSADIKCPSGNTSGLVTSFYLSSQEGSGTRDEITMEFLGKDKFLLQTKYLVDGVSSVAPFLHSLPFDCSEGFHNFAIDWSNSKITWFVDKKPIRVISKDDSLPYPSKPMFLYGAFWDASYLCGGCWAGKRAKETLEHVHYSFYAKYRNIKVFSS